MIEFLTLFLGVVSGNVHVELSTGVDTASVELRLDGSRAGLRRQAPWEFDIDLGIDPAPHALVGIAYDAAGRELARSRQWINVPRSSAETRIGLFGGAQGAPAYAAIAWEAVRDDRPEKALVRFDGSQLAARDLERVKLPPYDPESIHTIAVELEFADSAPATATAVFGGEFGDRVSTELTAVPLVFAGRRPPRAVDLAGHLLAEGARTRPVAVERAGADAVIVPDARSTRFIREIAHSFLPPSSRVGRIPRSDRLGEEDRLRFLWGRDSLAADNVHGPAREVFPISDGQDQLDGGLARLLFVKRPPAAERIADAVAIAAVLAASTERARAVVLIVDPSTTDRSEHRPHAVRRFLQRLNVPLHVWTTAENPEPLSAEWGEVTAIGSPRKMRLAVDRLRAALDRQTVVWLEGAHLPDRIELVDELAGIRIAGRGESIVGGRAEGPDVDRSGAAVADEDTSTDKTPLAIDFVGEGPPSLESLQTAFAAGGAPLRPLAIEKSRAELIFVLEPSAQSQLQQEFERAHSKQGRRRLELARREKLPLGRDGEARLVWTTTAQSIRSRGPFYEIFPQSGSFAPREQGLVSFLARYDPPPLPERVADAVAVAATLISPARRRAVVLIVDPETPDGSLVDVAAARELLARLQVPLFVWTTGSGPAAPQQAWGQTEDVAEWSDLESASARLRKALEKQAIVWLSGGHDPGRVRLHRPPEGVTILGR